MHPAALSRGCRQPSLPPSPPAPSPAPAAPARSRLSSTRCARERSDAGSAVSTPHPVIILKKMGSTINFPKGIVPTVIGRRVTTRAPACYPTRCDPSPPQPLAGLSSSTLNPPCVRIPPGVTATGGTGDGDLSPTPREPPPSGRKGCTQTHPF